jgi:hypothetical protein
MTTCAFCGDTFTNTKRTREHVIPLWLSDLLVKPGQELRHVVRLGEGREIARDWTAGAPNLIARRVCGICNEGWMNGLERAARSVLTRLVTGLATSLSADDQTVISAWATKTALALDLAGPNVKNIETSHYRDMASRKLEPPDYVTVFLGAFEHMRGVFFEPQWLTLNEGTRDEGRAYVSTFVIGHVVFQVYRVKFERPMSFTKGGALAQAYAQVWPLPTGTIEWPPPLILTDSSLAAAVLGAAPSPPPDG